MSLRTMTRQQVSDTSATNKMTFRSMGHPRRARSRPAVVWPLLMVAMMFSGNGAAGQAAGPALDSQDPRVGLGPGWTDAGQAARRLELVADRPRPQGFFNPAQMGDFGVVNTDLAFSGNHVFVGSYNGFQIWDISSPSNPRLRSSLVCPGGQGDVSVYRNLLFMSVEETRGRMDCGTQGVADTVSTDRFRGVRVFDIGNLDQPRQVAGIQTCRGSHTHTLVTNPRDSANVYVYVSGTGPVRSAGELTGCSGRSPEEDPNTSLFRIEVIRVPVAAPQDARSQCAAYLCRPGDRRHRRPVAGRYAWRGDSAHGGDEPVP